MINISKFKFAFLSKTNQWLLGISILACFIGLSSFLLVPKQVQSQENKDEKVTSLLRLGKVIPLSHSLIPKVKNGNYTSKKMLRLLWLHSLISNALFRTATLQC